MKNIESQVQEIGARMMQLIDCMEKLDGFQIEAKELDSMVESLHSLERRLAYKRSIQAQEPFLAAS